jgi:dihydrofolate synthase/folylpolyglutamate synthase
MAQVRWPGRLQQLQTQPAVFLDGAVTRDSAESVMASLADRIHRPLVSILAVPDDKDYTGVSETVGPQSDLLIFTTTERNPILSFPGADEAAAQGASYCAELADALALAREQAGADGTILILGTQSIVADVILLWGLSYESL